MTWVEALKRTVNHLGRHVQRAHSSVSFFHPLKMWKLRTHTSRRHRWTPAAEASCSVQHQQPSHVFTRCRYLCVSCVTDDVSLYDRYTRGEPDSTRHTPPVPVGISEAIVNTRRNRKEKQCTRLRVTEQNWMLRKWKKALGMRSHLTWSYLDAQRFTRRQILLIADHDDFFPLLAFGTIS